MKAADFANYARVPTDADIAALKANDVSRVIVGTSFGVVGSAQIVRCEAAGFEAQEFQFPEALRTPITDAWWLDVERTAHVTTQAEVRAACQSPVPPVGIYTSAVMWADLMGDWDIVAEFPFLKLWTANYGPLPRPFTPYGGWLKADMTQYQPTTDIGTGFEVDFSEYEEDEVKPFFAWSSYAGGSVWFVGPSGCGWVTTQTAINEIAALYQITNAPTQALSIEALHGLGG